MPTAANFVTVPGTDGSLFVVNTNQLGNHSVVR